LIDNTRTNVDDYHSFKWTKVTQLPLWNVSNKHFNQILFVNVKVNNEDYNEVGFDYVNARLIATQEYEGLTLEGVENVKRSNIIS
jgi:hypothetical protein